MTSAETERSRIAAYARQLAYDLAEGKATLEGRCCGLCAAKIEIGLNLEWYAVGGKEARLAVNMACNLSFDRALTDPAAVFPLLWWADTIDAWEDS